MGESDRCGDPSVRDDEWDRIQWAREKLPRWVDRYRLVRQIGEGAFGIVYAAEQREPIRRQVAVKIVKGGHESGEILARFDAERQALALMDHPNVAHVLDGGQTPDGRPYFVMELVRGEPLSDYCRRVRPGLRELLQLFAQICDGVAHAHQRGIIHRDLKPANILVEGEGASATPKVIDFGIAKATGALLTERTILTQTGQLLGTLEYMSPEQALTGGLDVDVRSDVYSLGAVLYELLCGRPPLQRMHKADLKLNEMLEKIEKEQPPKPSAAADVGVFLREGTDLVRASDLDWIVLKALDKERSRRYESPTEFAADIASFLEGRPVRAHAPTFAYKAGKFLRRNWRGVSAAAAVVLVLAGSIASVQAQRRAIQIERMANRFIEAPAVVAQEFLGGIREHAPHMLSLFEEAGGARGEIGLAMGGALPWRQTLLNAWGRPRDEVELALAATPQEEIVALAEIAWERSRDPSVPAIERLAAELTALRSDGAGDPRWEQQLEGLSRRLKMQALDGADWASAFRPLAERLAPHAIDRLHEARPGEISLLARVYSDLDPEFPDRLSERLGLPLPEGDEAIKDEFASQQAALGVALLHLDMPESVWPLFSTPAEMHDPRLRAYLTHRMAAGGIDPRVMLGQALDSETPLAVRAALLRAFADFDTDVLPPGLRGLFIEPLKSLLNSHPNARIHSECASLLARWGYSEEVARIERGQASEKPDDGQDWLIDSIGEAFVVFPGGLEFAVAAGQGGTLVGEQLDYQFALGMRPVTVGQLERCVEAMGMMQPIVPLAVMAPDDSCPAIYVSDQLAMKYCNWLSERAGLAPADFCYVERASGLRPAEGFLERAGYRVPTDLEWEFGCRAWANTRLPWGNDPALAERYCSLKVSSVEEPTLEGVLARAPNDLGLCGMLGNVEQLCHRGAGGWIKRGAPLLARADQLDCDMRGDASREAHFLMTVGFRLARTIDENPGQRP